jgi:hypothetical protein
MTTTTDDPIQAEVERVLRLAVTLPFTVATAVPRCVVRRLGAVCDRLGEPARIVRSLVDLVSAGGVRAVVEPDETPATDEPAVPLRLVIDDEPSAGAAARLPIDEYESLAASQVVARLPTLTPSELEEVRAFEAANRGRRTILGKIDQLLA